MPSNFLKMLLISDLNFRKNLALKLIEKERGNPDFWYWTGGFTINAVDSYNLLLRNKEYGQFKFLRATINLWNQILFIIVEEQTPETASLKVRNECEDVTIKIIQSCQSENSGITVPPQTTMPFAWAYPDKEREISSSFHKEGLFSTAISGVTFRFDVLNKIQQINIPIKSTGKEQTVFVDVVPENGSRILKFHPGNFIKKKEIKEKEKEILNMHLDVKIVGLGLSLIANISGKEKSQRVEVIHILLKGLEFALDDTNISKSSQFRVKYLNIDNNTSYRTSFPVFLTPSKPKELLIDNQKNYYLDTLIVQKPGSKDVFFSLIF